MTDLSIHAKEESALLLLSSDFFWSRPITMLRRVFVRFSFSLSSIPLTLDDIRYSCDGKCSEKYNTKYLFT
jgi:hypothetical protein